MDSSFSRMMIVLKQVTMILAVIPMTPETIWLPMYCPFPAKGDIKISIGLFLKHIESSCEGNDFLDAVKFRFPIFFPVKVKKAQRDFPDGANALNPSKGDVLFFSKGQQGCHGFHRPPSRQHHEMGFINFDHIPSIFSLPIKTIHDFRQGHTGLFIDKIGKKTYDSVFDEVKGAGP